MVRIPGIGTFRDRFGGDATLFVVIGGTARELIYEEAGFFRDSATKDLDVVLIAEAIDADFVDNRFMRFIIDGGYRHFTKDGLSQMYRFSNPKSVSFPYQVELLSRRADCMVGIEQQIGPVPVDDASYSLSAIMLDDDYYGILASGEAVTNKYGMPTLKHEYLPLFKMKAYNDLRDRRELGEGIRRDEINKHRRDIFKLCALPMPPAPVALSSSIVKEVERFLMEVECPHGYLKSIGLGTLTVDAMKAIISSYYLKND